MSVNEQTNTVDGAPLSNTWTREYTLSHLYETPTVPTTDIHLTGGSWMGDGYRYQKLEKIVC